MTARTSTRRDLAGLVENMRDVGRSWVEIAVTIQTRHRVNPRVALRLAHGWTQQQAAEAWNRRWPDDPKTLKAFSRWEVWPAASGHAPSFDVLNRLAELYQCTVADLVADLADHRHLDPANATSGSFAGLSAAPSRGTASGAQQRAVAVLVDVPAELPAVPRPRLPGGWEAVDMYRRDLLRLMTMVGVGATVGTGELTAQIHGREQLARTTSGARQVGDLTGVAAQVDDVKRLYQRCRYAEALQVVPNLLQLVEAGGSTGRAAPAWLDVAAADVYQVAASLLLKFGDVAAAMLAADRSMSAARRSQDPVSIASSARSVTHALTASSHHRTAAEFACVEAQRLHRSTTSATGLSVYGALLLRGAVAAARAEDRALASQLLDEADAAAARLGRDGNERWTAFGPVNVTAHRVNVAVSLGDAGQAIEHARRVRIDLLPAVERRACVFLDMARAYTQWGRHEQALSCLYTADRIAPQETRARRSARRVVADLTLTCPPSIRPRVRQFADTMGLHP